MANPLRGLVFPLVPMKLPGVLSAGERSLDLEVALKKGKYQGTFRDGKKPIKLALEKCGEHDFLQSFLAWYFFRQPEKEYAGYRQFLARVGLRDTSPLEMTYAEQKYVLTYRVRQDGQPLEVKLAYSPVIAQLVARAQKGS